LWFGAVTWGTPLIRNYPLEAARFNVAVVVGAAALLLWHRSKTTRLSEKKRCSRMLLLVAAGIAVSLASAWALHQA